MNKKWKTVETCNRKEKKDNVVIDVDNDSCSDAVDVDDPKFVWGSSYSGVRKDEKYSPTSVIYIDDGKDYDETTQYDNLDKGRYDEQNSNSVNISNSKRTYPGKASARNRYGLGTDSESALSDDDDSEGIDSEFEGFSEKLKQEWEKAFSRRQNEYFSRADQAGTSSFYSDSHQNIETGDRTARYSDGSDFISYTSHKERDRSPSIPTDNGDSESVSSDDGTDFLFEGFSGKLKEEWEKAFRRRQNEVFSSVDQDGDSRFCSNSHQDVGTGDKTERYSDDPNFTSYTSHKGVERSPSVPLDGGKSESTFCDNDCEASNFVRVNNVCNHESFISNHAGTSHTCTDNQHGEVEWKNNEDNSFVEKNDVASVHSSRIISNNSLFFNREMHKETDEYRVSVQAELEARERALQIQAEEAQQLKRLQKRKKAEALRVLDMERRQKLRVEEIRNTQKKDEEDLNLKEQLRAEVRKDLDRLEATCHNMTSILRCLGINLNGINGVHVAFKRALLTFHPDRASQSDIRQQVEAEEKFKLVNRMKEKYLSTF